MKESEKIRITNLVEKYAKSICATILKQGLLKQHAKLQSFEIFDMEFLPMSSSPSFCVHGKNEINLLAE